MKLIFIVCNLIFFLGICSYRIWKPESRIQNLKSKIWNLQRPNLESGMQSEFWKSQSGFWILDSGFQILDSRFQILISKIQTIFQIPDLVFEIHLIFRVPEFQYLDFWIAEFQILTLGLWILRSAIALPLECKTSEIAAFHSQTLHVYFVTYFFLYIYIWYNHIFIYQSYF